jgi:hypothetical protein
VSDRGRKLTLKVYCKNDEPLLEPGSINTLNVTAKDDFEGLTL